MERVTPIKDQVLVLADPAKDRTSSGLYYPQGSEDWPSLGTVMAVGPGRIIEGGEREPMGVEVGDRVLFKRQPASALVPDSREGDPRGWHGLVMLDEKSIIGVVFDEATPGLVQA